MGRGALRRCESEVRNSTTARTTCGTPLRQGSVAVLAWLLAAVLLSPVARADTTRATDRPPKAVLVTGASSGIGHEIAERLARNGYFVYATARKDADLAALGAIKNVQPVRLDVTDAADIAAAVELVTKAGRGLYGLVNNAGIGTYGTIADMSPSEFDLCMKVNVYGPVMMIKAFEPMLLDQKGRIVNIGSISGILASPNLPAYVASKHAIEGLTDSLAAQLAPLGVQVSGVEPVNYKSDVVKNMLARLAPDLRMKAMPGREESQYPEPTEVAAAVEQALFEPRPKRRYLVVTNDPRIVERTIRKQIEQLVQLNEGQPYTYDRADLIKMLDEALATARPRAK
jgi:NAD(P)-dependent dehydrogenase (short-subunit alcohol dehydrogenase family)